MLPRTALAGLLVLAVNFGTYPIIENAARYLSIESFSVFELLAYLHFVVLLAGMIIVTLGLVFALRERSASVRNAEQIPLSLGVLLPHMFTQRGVTKIFILSALLYGFFYSFATSMLVYRPDLRFSEVYNAKIPSIQISPCCGPPGQVPVLVGYLTENIGILLIPLTILLLVTVSGLVALNVSLTYYAWKNRPVTRQGWTIGLAAIAGLFTGCPTCAGLFLASMIGGLGATTLALSLAPLQSLLIAVTIPILFMTPYLILENMARVVEGRCIRPMSRIAPKLEGH